MKNILKSTAIAALMFISLTSMAYEPSTSLIKGSEAKSLVFKMAATAKGTVVSLSDAKANTLFYDDVTDKNYAKSFNLNNLEAGTYFLKVKDDAQSVVYTFEIEDATVKIIRKEVSKKTNVFDTDGKKVHLNLTNSDLSAVDIKIINEENAKVFAETLTSQPSIAKTFNFEKAIKGDYIISVKDGKKVYYQNVSVD
ncbi:hypothetical protein [uncultured Cyclobacterium sp.]|uniref:hypothetical protein n=1 Tax=uncultured Cyclobacterium sp. TaxID=453820 RepID=UPI0030EEDB8E|tara:strand:+ start:282165 stop:282752 length:588 start_codon:yes stop_codon:yes gene_type:complete